MERLHPLPVFGRSRKFGDRFQIGDVHRRRRFPESQVMVDEEHDEPQSVAPVVESLAHLRGEEGAGVFVMAHIFCPARVVEEKCHIHRDGIFHVLKDPAEKLLFGIFRMDEAIKYFDTAQGMLVGGIAVEELVLDQICQLSELGKIQSQETKLVHLAKDVRHLTAILKNLFEGGSIGPAFPEGVVDKVEVPADQLANFRARLQVPPLRVEEIPHQATRVFFKNGVVLRIDQAASRLKSVEGVFRRSLSGQEIEDWSSPSVIVHDFQFKRLHQRGALLIQVPSVAIVIPHEGFALPENVRAGDVEFRRDNPLQAEAEDISGATFLTIVQLISHPHEEFKGRFDVREGVFCYFIFGHESGNVARLS